MLHMHSKLELLDAGLFHKGLVVQEFLVPVNGLHVLVPVQELQQINATDAGRGDLGAICASCTQPECTSLTQLGIMIGMRNQGEAVGGGRGGGPVKEEGEDGGDDGAGAPSDGEQIACAGDSARTAAN